jgi:hypothetical protein
MTSVIPQATAPLITTNNFTRLVGLASLATATAARFVGGIGGGPTASTLVAVSAFDSCLVGSTEAIGTLIGVPQAEHFPVFPALESSTLKLLLHDGHENRIIESPTTNE